MIYTPVCRATLAGGAAAQSVFAPNIHPADKRPLPASPPRALRQDEADREAIMADHAFILTTVEVRDAQAFAAYRAAIAGLNDRIGGTMLVRGKALEMLEGDGEAGEVVIVIGFSGVDAPRDRKRVVSGKSVPVRGASG